LLRKCMRPGTLTRLMAPTSAVTRLSFRGPAASPTDPEDNQLSLCYIADRDFLLE
jgi:hypothetical protein